MILLDTTFLIDLLRKNKQAIAKTQELVNREVLATTYINIYELVLGIYSRENTDHNKKLQAVRLLVDKLIILTLDMQSTIHSARMGGELTLKGQVIGDTDNMIAGIALSNGISIIITRDKEHFQRIKGIKVESY